MSNAVGKLYEMIIDGVIHEAQVDFENLGVPLSTLQLLKTEWQKRLSAMNVTAYLPWDVNERWEGVANAPVYYNSYELGMPVMPGGAAAPAPQPSVLKQEDYTQYPPPPQDRGNGLVLPQVPQTDGTPVTQQDLLDVIAEKMAEKANAPSQVDGPGEEVGSDLDDSEDDLNSEDEEADNGMVMLCLYEKVQRVKNKWRFHFKDGVATINGSDYVFSRGNGEAEW